MITSLKVYSLHCKLIPCNENRISLCFHFYPVIIAGIQFSLQGIMLSWQRSCFHYRDIPDCSLFYLVRDCSVIIHLTHSRSTKFCFKWPAFLVKSSFQGIPFLFVLSCRREYVRLLISWANSWSDSPSRLSGYLLKRSLSVKSYHLFVYTYVLCSIYILWSRFRPKFGF